jgi:hypothetical protein
MVRSGVFLASLAACFGIFAAPVVASTYYVEQDQSSTNVNLDVSFSASGYLKLVIFDPNGFLDFLNPKAEAYALIYANTSVPSSATGTLDADVVGSDLTLSGMDVNLLADGPESMEAGAQIHADEIPFLAEILEGLLADYLDQIDPNIFDPNIITDLIAELLGGIDFEYTFDMSVNALTMTKTGDPVTATINGDGTFDNLLTLADIDSEIQFNGGDPINLPSVPLPFLLDGTYTDTPVGTITLGGDPAEGGVDTPEVVIIDRIILLPIGESGIDVTFQLRLAIDAGHASYTIGPQLQAIEGYLLTTDVDPAGTGTVERDIAGPLYAPGTEVELTAVDAEGWDFSNWDGDLSGSANPATITMDGHKSVTAVFVEGLADLTVLYAGAGSGFVSVSPGGGTYAIGTEVMLVPTPTGGSEFAGWSGDIEAGQEDDNPLVLVMDADKTVTATFDAGGSTCGTEAVMPLAVGLVACTFLAVRRRW